MSLFANYLMPNCGEHREEGGKKRFKRGKWYVLWEQKKEGGNHEIFVIET